MEIQTFIYGVIILAVVIVVIIVLVRLIISGVHKRDIHKTTLNPYQESDSAVDNRSKAEAVKQQLQRGNPVAINSGSSHNSMGPGEISSIPAFQKTIQPTEGQIIKINIEPEETQSQAASEVVDVPKGVVIKVKRVRTIEHTVNIEWGTTITGKGEAGFLNFVSASIQGEIQRVKGYVSQQSESTEYEITLDGEKYNQYKLVWIDVWVNGTADIRDSHGSYTQPFQFRDRTELKVFPF